MGLDMYMERIHRNALEYRDKDIAVLANQNPVLYDAMTSFMKGREISEHSDWSDFFEGVGYWRKANAIHKWFVENVQGGEDDCGRYEVEQGVLKELREVAQEVVDCSVLVSGEIHNGTRFNNGVAEKVMEHGKIVSDPSVAKELLPTTDGFFFGCTDYNEYYIGDLLETIAIIDKVLEETDFDVFAIFYTSSW
jgi:hypothetical protein